MEIAALIISCLSLIIGTTSLCWLLGKHWSSTTIIEKYRELDLSTGTTKPIVDPYKSIDDPLSDEEKEYFQKHNNIQ